MGQICSKVQVSIIDTGNKGLESRFGMVFHEFLRWIFLVIFKETLFSKLSSFHETATAQTWFLFFFIPDGEIFSRLGNINISWPGSVSRSRNKLLSQSRNISSLGKFSQSVDCPELPQAIKWILKGLLYYLVCCIIIY